MICKLLLIIIFSFGTTVVATAQFKEEWQDKSPHKSAFVNVDGVKLHYLDWGGKGKALLFP